MPRPLHGVAGTQPARDPPARRSYIGTLTPVASVRPGYFYLFFFFAAIGHRCQTTTLVAGLPSMGSFILEVHGPDSTRGPFFFFLVRYVCPGDDRVRRSSSRGSGVAAGGRLPAGGAGLLAGHRYGERLCVSFIAVTGTELVGLVGRAAEQCRRLTFGRLDRAGCLGHVSFPSARFCLLAWQGARDVFTALFDRVPACLTELGKLVAA